MRIFNQVDAYSDVETYFGVRGSDNESELWVQWLKQVWIKHLFKTDPGWCFPIKREQAPSFMKGLNLGKKMIVDVPKFGVLELYPQSEWDLKDADAGTLVYYKPSSGTLFQYASYLAPLRDYLKQEVFKDQDLSFNFKKYAVPNVEAASAKWHAEAEERSRREAEERRRLANSTEPVDDRDWSKVAEFSLNGDSYVLLRLLTQTALTFESDHMHHCVRGYGSALTDGRTVILSIRKLGEPRQPKVTVELSAPAIAWKPGMPWNCAIVQTKGPCNEDADKFVPNIHANIAKLVNAVQPQKFQPLNAPGSLSFKVS